MEGASDPCLIAPRGAITAPAFAWPIRQLPPASTPPSAAWPAIRRCPGGGCGCRAPELEHVAANGVPLRRRDEPPSRRPHPAPRRPAYHGRTQLIGKVDPTRDADGRAMSACWTWSRAGRKAYVDRLGGRSEAFRGNVQVAGLDPFNGDGSALDEQLEESTGGAGPVPRREARQGCGGRGASPGGGRPLQGTAAASVTRCWGSSSCLRAAVENLADKRRAHPQVAIEADEDEAHDEVFVAWQFAQVRRADDQAGGPSDLLFRLPGGGSRVQALTLSQIRAARDRAVGLAEQLQAVLVVRSRYLSILDLGRTAPVCRRPGGRVGRRRRGSDRLERSRMTLTTMAFAPCTMTIARATAIRNRREPMRQRRPPIPRSAPTRPSRPRDRSPQPRRARHSSRPRLTVALIAVTATQAQTASGAGCSGDPQVWTSVTDADRLPGRGRGMPTGRVHGANGAGRSEARVREFRVG